MGPLGPDGGGSGATKSVLLVPVLGVGVAGEPDAGLVLFVVDILISLVLIATAFVRGRTPMPLRTRDAR